MIVRPLPSSGHYELRENMQYPGGMVPNGFSWDGASIPRVAWTALGYSPFHPAVLRASCVHDYLYTIRTGTRRDADALFRTMLSEDGVTEELAAMMFAAVRQFGLRIWTDEEDARELEHRAQQARRRVEEAP